MLFNVVWQYLTAGRQKVLCLSKFWRRRMLLPKLLSHASIPKLHKCEQPRAAKSQFRTDFPFETKSILIGSPSRVLCSIINWHTYRRLFAKIHSDTMMRKLMRLISRYSTAPGLLQVPPCLPPSTLAQQRVRREPYSVVVSFAFGSMESKLYKPTSTFESIPTIDLTWNGSLLGLC